MMCPKHNHYYKEGLCPICRTELDEKFQTELAEQEIQRLHNQKGNSTDPKYFLKDN